MLEHFLKDNVSKDELPTAPAIAHFQIALEMNPEVEDELQGMMSEIIYQHQPGREEEMLAQRKEIEAAATCAQIIHLLRRHTDPLNQRFLVNKALEFEEDIIPEIVNKFKTSLNTGFIETSIRILAKSTVDVSETIIAYFDEIRNPYAQSMALVLLGFKCGEEHIPWFIEKYKTLKRLYPQKSYCEGAYYGVHELGSRIYPTGKRQTKRSTNNE